MKTLPLLTPRPLDTIQPAVDRLLTCKQVEALVGRCRRTLMRWVKTGYFLAPIELASNRLAWRESEVVAWIRSRQPGTVRPELSAMRSRIGRWGCYVRWHLGKIIRTWGHHQVFCESAA